MDIGYPAGDGASLAMLHTPGVPCNVCDEWCGVLTKDTKTNTYM